jgi:hypothetical protein
MSAAGELLSRGFSMGGHVKNAELAAIKAGVVGGRYTRHGNNRKANLAKAEAMLKWYVNSEAKGKAGGKAFQSRRNFAANLSRALARSPSASPSGSRAASPSRASAVAAAGAPAMAPTRPAAPKESRANKPKASRAVTAKAAGGNNKKPTRTYTRKSRSPPPASGQWPLLKKGVHLYSVKVVPLSSNTVQVVKVHGTQGGEIKESPHTIIQGKAGRSVLQQALHEAEAAFEDKRKEGYTEVRSVSRGANNEIKSMKNFIRTVGTTEHKTKKD